MDKWICRKCGHETTEKPYKNQLCGKDGCKGRFKKHRQCKCGAWFEVNDPKAVYCSPKCESKGEHKFLLTCCQCGKEFVRYKSNIKGSKQSSFCGIECQREYEKTLKEQRICEQCGEPFVVYKSAIRGTNATGRFCSRTCHDQSLMVPGSNGYRADFGKVKKKYFNKTQFCAFCGTTKNIHIHHIIPFRITQDNSVDNLIPLCAKHHVQFENYSRPFIESMGEDIDAAKFMLNSMLRRRQRATREVIVDLANKRRADEGRKHRHIAYHAIQEECEITSERTD